MSYLCVSLFHKHSLNDRFIEELKKIKNTISDAPKYKEMEKKFSDILEDLDYNFTKYNNCKESCKNWKKDSSNTESNERYCEEFIYIIKDELTNFIEIFTDLIQFYDTKASDKEKIEGLVDHYQGIKKLLEDPDVYLTSKEKFKTLMEKLSNQLTKKHISKIIEDFKTYFNDVVPAPPVAPVAPVAPLPAPPAAPPTVITDEAKTACNGLINNMKKKVQNVKEDGIVKFYQIKLILKIIHFMYDKELYGPKK